METLSYVSQERIKSFIEKVYFIQWHLHSENFYFPKREIREWKTKFVYYIKKDANSGGSVRDLKQDKVGKMSCYWECANLYATTLANLSLPLIPPCFLSSWFSFSFCLFSLVLECTHMGPQVEKEKLLSCYQSPTLLGTVLNDSKLETTKFVFSLCNRREWDF